MFGEVTALEGSHVTGKYRDESMMHACSRHAAWVPPRHHSWPLEAYRAYVGFGVYGLGLRV